MTRIGRVTLVVIVLFLTVGFALTRAHNSAETAQLKRGGRRSAELLRAKGREVYTANCARCHGGDGLGKTKLGELVEAPDISDTKWQGRRSDRRLQQSVVKGRGQMPAFGGKLTKSEIAAAIAYVRSLRK
jgi:mono/diheme cytochrome c family protein